MRAVAKAAGTTTPTVYERYRNREDILLALRLRTRRELFAALTATQSLREAIESYLKFALANRHAYEVLFDGVGQPPSLHEPWPSFNLMRGRLAQQLKGTPRQNNRLMLAIWCQMHGTAMLIIRGEFEGALHTQAVHACMDAVENLIRMSAQGKAPVHSGPKWPPNLILGEGEQSRVGNGEGVRGARKSKGRKAAS
jgi:AcrR family transcriptional regulator